jgi:hypothetical protein
MPWCDHSGLDAMTDHICSFPEVMIEEAEGDDDLKAGMSVLIPCPVCGESASDTIALYERHIKELEASLLSYEPLRAMYHWAPVIRRKQIIRYGLLPGKRPTTTQGDDRRIPYVCLGDSPSWAWALSGAMKYTPKGEWDLWMTWMDRIKDPVVHADPSRHTGLYEVRTEHRIYKRDIWYVGSRVKQ